MQTPLALRGCYDLVALLDELEPIAVLHGGRHDIAPRCSERDRALSGSLRKHDRRPSMTELTSALARFASARPIQTIPENVAAIIRSGFIDTTATMIAGRSEPVVNILRAYLAERI